MTAPLALIFAGTLALSATLALEPAAASLTGSPPRLDSPPPSVNSAPPNVNPAPPNVNPTVPGSTRRRINMPRRVCTERPRDSIFDPRVLDCR
jgi:hypothetical protein